MVVRRLLIPAALAADALLFFARPLFSKDYSFPWDFRLVQLPLITFLADQLNRHDLPLWDPYTYCGNPIYANIQACFFHPLVFLAAALSNIAGPNSLSMLLEWAVVLQVLIAGSFTYKIARYIGCSRSAALAAGVICQTGPYFASRAEHIGAMMAAAWLPAAWYSVLRMREQTDTRMLALLAASLGLSVAGGSPAATTAVFASTLLLAILLWITRLGRSANIFRAALGCALGLGVSAVVWIPSAELTRNSVAKYRLDWLGSGGGMHWQSLVSLFLPNYSHIFDLANFKGPGDPTFLYLFSSITGLAFAVLVLVRRRDPWVLCFACLALAGGLFMLGDSLPLWSTLYPLLPAAIRIGIHPEFTYCVFAECVALLAGLGIARLLPHPSLKWAAAGVIALELYFAGSGRPMNCVSLRADPGLSPEILQSVRAYAAQDFPPARVDNTSGVSIAWPEAAPLTRVPTASGDSPLAPERIIQLRLGLHAGGRAGWYYPVANVESNLLDLLGDRFVLAAAPLTAQLDRDSRFRKIDSLPGALLYENTRVMPRAFVVAYTVQAPFLDDARILRAPNFNVRTTATLEPPAPALQAEDRSPIQANASFTEYSPNHLAVSVTTSRAGLLVLTEAWYPGWEARLDGRPVPIYIADAAFRGVALPTGTHRLTMDFQPRILLLSAAVSLLFLCGLAIVYISHFRAVKQSRIAR